MQTTRIRPTDRVASRRARLGLAIHPSGLCDTADHSLGLWQHVHST